MASSPSNPLPGRNIVAIAEASARADWPDCSKEGKLDLEAQCSRPFSDLETRASSGDLTTAPLDDCSITNPDLSRNPSGLSESTSTSRVAKPSSFWKPAMTRRLACQLSGCAVFLVLLASALVFLWPRRPDWKVQELIVPPIALNNVIQAVTSPSDNNVTVEMDARVDFLNPNFIGAEAGVGHFSVTWEGQELASVTTESGTAPARAHNEVVAHSMSVISPALGKLLMDTLPGQSFEFTVIVQGQLPATVKSLFGLRVKVDLLCSVDVSVLLILSEPEKMVTGHRCTYGVRF